MGQEIVYCHRCQTRLLGSDFDRGKAFRINQQATCGECARKILEELPQAERDAILGRSKEPEATPKKTGTARIPIHQKSSGDSSHNRIHAVTSRSLAPHAKKQSSALPLVLGIGAIVVVGLIIVAAASSGGGGSTPPAPRLAPPPQTAVPAPAPATPAPPPPPRPLRPRTDSPETRLAEAKRLFAAAQTFAAANPNDLPGQIDRFQQAAFAADGTALAGETAKALADAKAKLKTSFAADLADLRKQVLAAAKSGRIAHAAAQIEKRRNAFTSADWTAALHRLKEEVEPFAETAFRPLKEEALKRARSGDRAGSDRILNRVRTWGFRRLVDDLLEALGKSPTAPTPKPAAAKPAPALDYVVFGDALRAGWKNHSWDTDANLEAENPVHTGTRSIAFTPRKAWAGLRLKSKEPLSTADYPTLTFAARRTDRTFRFTVSFYDENNKRIAKPVKLVDAGGIPPLDSWQTYTISAARLGATGRRVSAIVFQAQKASETPALFVDDVGFLKTLVPDATPAPGAATGYQAEWMNAAALASVRDYDAAAAILAKAEGEEAKQDLADLRAAAALLDVARKAFAAWPDGRNLDVLYADASGVAARIDEPVRESDADRALVRGAPKPVSIPFGEILSGSLAAIALRDKAQPTDAEKRAAALLSLFEGDVAAAYSFVKSPPAKYLAHARAAAQKRVSDKKELAARALLYQAEAEFADYATRGEALKKYASLLKDHAATDVVRRNQKALDTRRAGGREYFFGLIDLTGSGSFSLKEHDKETTAWTCEEDVAAPSDRLNTYVELEFSALADTEYRAWAYVGGCCAETFAFNLQATDLEGFEPGSQTVSEVDHGVRYLKKTHALHGGGPKQPEKWSWARIRLPKYSSAGVKKVRLLSHQKGFSVAFAIVSADRQTPLRTTEAQERARDRSRSITQEPSSLLSTGSILREVWEGINGNSVSDLTGSDKFKGKPDLSAPAGIFEAPPGRGNQYGTRMRGYVHPPETGDYTFWIATDDKGELWLSTNGRERNKTKIASVPTAVLNRQWGAHGSQKSKPIRLEKGRRYYVEALHKEGGGDDWLAVGWQLPNGKMERPIPGNRLSPYLVPGSGPVAVRILTPDDGAVIEAGSPVVIEAEVAGADKSARVEIFQGGRRLGTPRGDPLRYTWRNPDPGSYPLTAVITERGKEAVTSPPVRIRVGEEAFLFRAINLNGPGVFIGSRSWQGMKSPGFRTSGWGLERQDLLLDPPTGAEHAQMLRSSISSAEGTRVSLRGVPKGSYRVYLYVWAPETSASFDIALNDTVVASGQRIGPAGAWARLGPWRAEANAGILKVEARRGTVHFSGVEVWKLGTPPPAPKNPARTGVIGGRGGSPFEDEPANRPFLIGLRVTRGTFQGKPHAKTVQPIYLKDGTRSQGNVHGDAGANPVDLVAKDGYAVGAVVGKGGSRIRGFKVVFYRINGTVLNPADAYESEWIGGEGTGAEKRLDGEGAPVVGIHGRSGGDADCFGLIYLK